MATCAPADGPAMLFALAPNALACPPDAPAMIEPGDTITVYGEITGPMTITFAPSGPNGQGVATSCKADGQCFSATEVSLTLTSYTPTATMAMGFYELELADGTTSSGMFAVPVCQIRLSCG